MRTERNQPFPLVQSDVSAWHTPVVLLHDKHGNHHCLHQHLILQLKITLLIILWMEALYVSIMSRSHGLLILFVSERCKINRTVSRPFSIQFMMTALRITRLQENWPRLLMKDINEKCWSHIEDYQSNKKDNIFVSYSILKCDFYIFREIKKNSIFFFI